MFRAKIRVQPLGFEMTLAVVSDIPAQGVVTDFIIFVALFLPFLGGKAQERRQLKAVFLQKPLKFFDTFVDL